MPVKNALVTAKDETAQVPSAMLDFGDDAGAGYQDETNSDVVIPRLSVLQGLSPQVVAEDSDMKPGMIYNSVTKEAVKGSEGLVIIPVTRTHQFIEWVPRLQGGGFVASHAPESDVVKNAKAESKKFGKFTHNGNDLVETFTMYVVDATTGGYMIIDFTSTKIRQYQGWNTACKLFNHTAYGIPKRPPMFAHKVKLTTELEHRPGGDSYNYRLAPVNAETVVNGVKRPAILNSMIGVDNPLFVEAKGFLNLINSGVAKATPAMREDEDHVEAPRASTGKNDFSKAPF